MFRNLPVTVRVSLATARMMILLGPVATQGVLAALGRLQDECRSQTARLHVEGLSAALVPSLRARGRQPRTDIDLGNSCTRPFALNLILNAGTAAGRAGKIGLHVTGKTTGLRVLVSDSGPGVSPFDLARLMGTGPLPSGGGIGLRLVRGFVRALEGGFPSDSFARSTEIRLDLPLRKPADA
jgi:hypothetical protein